MEGVPDQDPKAAEDAAFRKSIVQARQSNNSSLSFESETPILDETIAIVTEKVWSFRSALKAAAEALVNFGLSPQVVGYSSVPASEDEQLAEKNEGEAALQKVVSDEVLSRTTSSDVVEARSRQGRAWEGSRLVSREDYEDDANHAFVEAGRKDTDERKSLTRRTYDVNEEDEERDNRN